MSCPFANSGVNGSLPKNNKFSSKIYDLEEKILNTKNILKELKREKESLEEKKFGRIENVEKEFNKFFTSFPLNDLNPLLGSIVYTLKNLEKKLEDRQLENINAKCDDKPRDDFTN